MGYAELLYVDPSLRPPARTMAHSIHEATAEGGRMLLVNTISRNEGIMSPWLIRSYRDLFAHVGYSVETEETMRGEKETVEFEILMSLFVKGS